MAPEQRYGRCRPLRPGLKELPPGDRPGLSRRRICSHLPPRVLLGGGKLFWGERAVNCLLVAQRLLQLGSWPPTAAFKRCGGARSEREPADARWR